MSKILFIQSGHTERAAQCLDVVLNKAFPSDTTIDFIADDVHPYLPASSIRDLNSYYLLKPGILKALLLLGLLWRTRYDAVIVLFTKEEGFLKHKAIGVLARKKKLLVFNENVDYFNYQHAKMYRHLRWRWLAFLNSNRSGYLRSVNDGIKVIKNEGFKSFFRKCWHRLSTRRKVTFKPKLRCNIGPLTFPLFENPKVSIVIPVYNKILYTTNCLASILEMTSDTTYEIIVVDDNSSDATEATLSKMKNLQVLRSEENKGFVGSCNAGAEAARGAYILFLNNDTTVTPGWLSSLARVLDDDATCGAVGSKLVYPDGALQEAGGIIWKDASGWNYGKFDDASRPEYNYLREVDYCSGAALMVRSTIFAKLDGFDKRFAPAYWEDTDLCFSVRKLGYRVIYQPASVVIHYEGISAGTSTTSGMKRYQQVNTAKFIDKWSAELSQQFEHSVDNLFLARDRNRGKCILVIDHYVPTYDKDAGSFFMYSLLRALVDLGYRVVFWPDNLHRNEPYTGVLQQIGVEVIYGRHNFTDYLDKNHLLFDAAILTRNHIAINFIDAVRKKIPRVIYHDPDLEFLREQRRIQLESASGDELQEIKEREFYLFKNCDIIGIHSPVERDIILTELPNARVEVIPLPINQVTACNTGFNERNGLLFVGSTHPPNLDAIGFFLDSIFPLIRAKQPEIKLYIIGEIPRSKLKEANLENVIFTGFVEDLLPYFKLARVYIAPLRYGAGIKGKILEAMSYGMPVVTTTIGAEGIGLTSNQNACIEDKELGFANAVLSLHQDVQFWEDVRLNGQQHVNENFSQTVFKREVKLTIDKLLTI